MSVHNTAINVNRKLLRALLDATVSTALAHRNTPNELYALGQMEAAANLTYLLACRDDCPDDLEEYCQQVAEEAIKRAAKIIDGVRIYKGEKNA